MAMPDGPNGLSGEADAPIKVLVVEDEPAYAEALVVGLGAQGFDVVHVADGNRAVEQFAEIDPDIVLLDVMLPGRDGVSVCRELRKTSAVPIVMVTALGDEIDTVVGLEVGADDYVTKPYRMRELVARIRALLRRAAAEDPESTLGSSESGSTVLVVGPITFDTDRHECTVNGEPVQLPRKEFELLRLLMANAGRVLPRETLIERIWGWDYEGDTKTLDVHIKRLRRKVELDPANPTRIITLRGIGYKLADTP